MSNHYKTKYPIPVIAIAVFVLFTCAQFGISKIRITGGAQP